MERQGLERGKPVTAELELTRVYRKKSIRLPTENKSSLKSSGSLLLYASARKFCPRVKLVFQDSLQRFRPAKCEILRDGSISCQLEKDRVSCKLNRQRYNTQGTELRFEICTEIISQGMFKVAIRSGKAGNGSTKRVRFRKGRFARASLERASHNNRSLAPSKHYGDCKVSGNLIDQI